MLYGGVFIASTLLFWRESPAGIILVTALCAGDGFAGLIGEQF